MPHDSGAWLRAQRQSRGWNVPEMARQLRLAAKAAISLATHHYFAGAALAEITGAEQEVARELERATSLYAAGPAPGEEHWIGGRALASIDLATVRLRTGLT